MRIQKPILNIMKKPKRQIEIKKRYNYGCALPELVSPYLSQLCRFRPSLTMLCDAVILIYLFILVSGMLFVSLMQDGQGSEL